MQFRTLIFGLSIAAALPFCGGCASLISGRKAEVAFTSNPPGAQVIVNDQRGRTVASAVTPGVVTLKRNRPYFMPARYTATFVAPGYETAHVPLKSTVNPWIAGNLVFGGIPGLVVDNATGAAWKPSNDEVHKELSPAGMPPQPVVSSDSTSPKSDSEVVQTAAQEPGDAAAKR